MSDQVIIIGGGLAGLSAANRALGLGLKVTVLEQGSDADYFCNSRIAGGIVHVAFRDVTKDVEDIRGTVSGQTGENDATAHAGLLAEEGARALAWIREEGAKFIKGGQFEFMRWIMAPPRRRTAGLDWKGRGPDVTLRRLTANLEERGGTLRRGVRGKELIIEDGKVTGVITDAGERIAAHAVVIADGGFQANPDLVRKYISPLPEKLIQRGAGTGFGAGMLMAEAAGAALVGMDRFYGHLLGQQAFENDQLWPYPIIDPIAQASILVDKSGSRFTDEGLGGVYMANEVAKLDDPLAATAIFDEAVWTGIAADNRYPALHEPGLRTGRRHRVASTGSGRAGGTDRRTRRCAGPNGQRIQCGHHKWRGFVPVPGTEYPPCRSTTHHHRAFPGYSGLCGNHLYDGRHRH